MSRGSEQSTDSASDGQMSGDATLHADPGGAPPPQGTRTQAPRDWRRLGSRALPALLPWLVAIAIGYSYALKAPDPGVPQPIAWLLSPIETNPFRACNVGLFEAGSPPPAQQRSNNANFLIRESVAQDAPVEQSAPGKGDFSNAAPEPMEQQQQVPIEPQPPLAMDPARLASGCGDQGFGDLVDVAADHGGQHAWAINAHGQVYRTLDGGRRWERQELPGLADGERLTNIALADDGASLAISVAKPSGYYRFYRTDDGGDSWRDEVGMNLDGRSAQTMGFYPGLITGMSLGPGGSYLLVLDGAAVDGAPVIWRTSTRSWQVGHATIDAEMMDEVRSHNFSILNLPLKASGANTLPILAWEYAGNDTTLRLKRLEAPSEGSEPVESTVKSFALDVGVLRGMAASESGKDIFIIEPTAILRGNSANDRWSRIDLAALAPDRAFALAGIDVANGGRTIMAAGTNALFISHNGGASFFEPPFGRAPAPWYYLLLFGGPFLVFYVLRPRKPETITIKGDKSNALSDRAQGLKGGDALNLRAYAEGIFDLLRNAATEPPLVIGVTGPWGSGKSSVMLKLSELLAEKQMPTVWFNAWHHQNEEHLLASMLSNIRSQGVPSFWSNPGFRLRWRMLTRRLSTPDPLGAFLWSWFLLLLAALLIPGGLLLWGAHSLNLVPALATLTFDWGNVANSVSGAFCRNDAECGNLVNGVAALLPGGKLGAILAFLVSLLSLDRLGRVALITRGFDPAKLMATMMPAGRNPKLDEQLSFRHRFGDELRSTAQALKPYRMVIFIDDLDRCRPENVVAVLEAVNFVVTEADCYVVIGMDRLYVLRAIRQQFEKFIAMEAAERKTGGAGAPEADEGRPQDFAEHYLEKLINLFVAVPKMSEAAREKLMEQMAGAEHAIPEPERPRIDWASWLRRAAAALVIGIVVLTPTLYLVGKPAIETGQPQQSGSPDGVQTGQDGTEPPAESSKPETGAVIAPQIAAGSAAHDATVPTVDASALLGYVLIVLAIAATAVLAVLRALNVPPDLLKHDTSVFRTELRNAEKRLASYLTTPRRAKRFVNRLRLFASVLKSTRPLAPRPVEAPPQASLPVPDSDRLDRQVVVAGTLHALGRELLAAQQGAGGTPPQRLVERITEIYGQTPDHPAIDQLYWRFWGVIDGARSGDPEIANLLPADVLKPPADDDGPDGAAGSDAASERASVQATAAQ